MDLEHDRALEPFILERFVEVDDCDLEDVRSEALDPSVHRLTFAGLPDLPIVRREFGDLPTPPEKGLGVAPFTGQLDRVLHVLLHGRERSEVTLEDFGCLGHRDVEALRKPVSLHAVGEAVRHHLRFRPFLDMDILGSDVEHGCGRCRVNVVAGLERPDQARILRKVSDASQLDLVVVGDQELVPLPSDKGRSENSPPLGADGNVVQVRLIRREAAGSGHGLLERGADPVSLADLGEQTLAVGRPQLLDFAVLEEVLDDRMLSAHLFERLGVGRIAGFRLLLWGEPEFVEQHFAQLLGGVDVEVVPGMLDHGGPLGLRLGDEFIPNRLQHVRIDTDASILHLREHPHERHLEFVVEGEQPLRGHRLAERRHEVVHGERHKARLLGSIRRGAAVEIKLSFGRARLREFHATVSEQQRTEVVDVVGRIEQVGSEAGIDRKVTDIDTMVVEPSHRRLGPVHRHGTAVGAEEHPQGVEHRRVVEKVALHETDIGRVAVDHEGEPTVDSGFRHTESEHIGTSPREGKRSGRSGGRVVHRDAGDQRLSGLTAGLAENRSETVPERAELEEVEELLDDVGIGCALGQVVEPKVELNVADKHHHLDVVADVGLVACEVLS